MFGFFHSYVWWCILPDASFESWNSDIDCPETHQIVVWKRIPIIIFHSFEKHSHSRFMCEHLKISVFRAFKIVTQFRRAQNALNQRAQTMKTLAVSTESWKQFVKRPKFQFSQSSRWIHCTISQRNFFGNVGLCKVNGKLKYLQTQFTLHCRCSYCREFYSMWDISSSILWVIWNLRCL